MGSDIKLILRILLIIWCFIVLSLTNYRKVILCSSQFGKDFEIEILQKVRMNV